MDTGVKLLSDLSNATQTTVPASVEIIEKKDTVGYESPRHANWQRMYEALSSGIEKNAQFDPFDAFGQKIRNASLRDIVWCLTQVVEQIRLEEGKTTQNVGITLIVEPPKSLDYGNASDHV